MEYNGKKSKIVWHPECKLTPFEDESFNNAALFANKDEAKALITHWAHLVSTYKDHDGKRKPLSNTRVKDYGNFIIVSDARGYMRYKFVIEPMNYFE